MFSKRWQSLYGPGSIGGTTWSFEHLRYHAAGVHPSASARICRRRLHAFPIPHERKEGEIYGKPPRYGNLRRHLLTGFIHALRPGGTAWNQTLIRGRIWKFGPWFGSRCLCVCFYQAGHFEASGSISIWPRKAHHQILLPGRIASIVLESGESVLATNPVHNEHLRLSDSVQMVGR